MTKKKHQWFVTKINKNTIGSAIAVNNQNQSNFNQNKDQNNPNLIDLILVVQ